jgi:hypothetical protein
MKVKCINTSMLMGGPTRPLTTGKIYDVISTKMPVEIEGDGSILIKGDDDEERWYSLERFEDVTAEVREQKLNDLGI